MRRRNRPETSILVIPRPHGLAGARTGWRGAGACAARIECRIIIMTGAARPSTASIGWRWAPTRLRQGAVPPAAECWRAQERGCVRVSARSTRENRHRAKPAPRRLRRLGSRTLSTRELVIAGRAASPPDGPAEIDLLAALVNQCQPGAGAATGCSPGTSRATARP